MNKLEAKNLIVNTFEKPFNEAQYTYFIKNLFNNLDESKYKDYRGNLIPDSFSDAVSIYKRIGQYKDSNNNVIDILTVKLKKETSLERARSLLRNFIARHLKQHIHDAALVAYYTDGSTDWRFSLVKMDINLKDKKIETDFTPARRYSFLVGTNEGSHTAQNQFVKLLTEKEENPTLDKIEDAFNIETVTKEFFLKYRDLFIRIKQSLDIVIKIDSNLETEFKTKEINSVDFAKKLLGQIVFLYFLQKKGWFGVEKNSKWGSGSKKFLREIFENKHGSYNNFFNDILEPLFYEALSDDRSSKDHYYSRFNCKIPFLNGGLFDPIGNYDWVRTDIILPNELFSNHHQTKEGDIGDGILDIFDRYNFTVIEDEPLEKEVAIDPELLGKAYEKFNAIRPDNFDEYLKVLQSGNKGEESKFNKQYGVFYTPREIVHYMCQQSLMNYLSSELFDSHSSESESPKVSKEDIEFLIFEGDKFVEHLRTAKEKNEKNEDYTGKYKESNHFLELKGNAKEIDNLLSNVKMCDPAVGSGAFPVGMMNEIMKARMFFVLTSCLDDKYINPHNQNVIRNSYNFKRDCIENSLYGVDIDSGAVEIAKLRLWLSLVVDEDDITNIKALPNLDYKIVCGNSLLSFPENWKSSVSDKIEFLKNEYFTETHPKRKKELKEEIDSQIKSRMINSKKYLGYPINFDFKTFFSEVFHYKGGFDIIIANPPYSTLSRVSGGSNKNSPEDKIQKELLRELFPNSAEYKISMYAIFMDKGLNLLSKKGFLCFITPDSFLSGRYFSKIRHFILSKCSIINILLFTHDFWENATVGFPTISFFRNESVEAKRKNNLLKVTLSESINLISSKSFKSYSYSQEYFYITPYNRFRMLFDSASYNIIKKMESHTFVADEIIDMHVGVRPKVGYDNIQSTVQKSPQWLPGFVKGNEINRYICTWNGNYIHINPKLLWAGGFDAKIISQNKLLLRKTGNDLIAAYDDSGFYHLDIIHSITLKDSKYNLLFLLALFNSKLLNYYYKTITLSFNRVLAQTNIETILGLPIPNDANSFYNKIINLIVSIRTTKNINFEFSIKHLEDQIDIMVYKLYNLTYEEVKIIDPDIEQIISKEEYERFTIE